MNQFHNQGLQIRAKLTHLLAKINERKFSLKPLLKRCLPVLFAISFATVLLLDNLQSTAQLPPQLPSSATIIQPDILQPRQLPRQEIRGVWVSTNDFNIMRTRSGLKDAVSQLRRLNFNTIYPVVWNSGYTKFPSVTATRAGIPFFFKGTDGQ
ncbi:MAG: family 10 glycosylhydrolase, partial [Cyanobacteria bacterium J06649_11]